MRERKIVFNVIVLFLIVLIISINLVSSQFGFDDPDLPKVTRDPPTVITFDNDTGAVNTSDLWDGLDIFNTTQMEDNGGVLNILVSWLTSFLLETSGDTMTGSLTINTSTSGDVFSLIESDGHTEAFTIGVFPSGSVLKLFTNGAENIVLNSTSNGDVRFNIDKMSSTDFIVSGDTVTNLFFVDASSDRIGIGTANPNGILSVENVGGSDTVNLLTFSEDENAEFYFESGFAGNGATGNFLKLNTFWTNNTMVWTGDGNIGIGTASPRYILEVSGAGSTRAVNLSNTLFVDASVNRVGIGTVAPDRLLHLESGSANVYMKMETDSKAWFVGVGSASGDDKFVINDDITDFFVIDTLGNIGIGTATPQNLLNVLGDVNFTSNFTVDANTFFIDSVSNRVGIGTSNPRQLLELSGGGLKITGTNDVETSANTTYIDQFLGIAKFFSHGKDISTRGAFQFVISNTDRSDIIEALFIQNDGFIGLGTTSPSNRLNILGSGNILNITSTTSGDANIRLEADADNSNEDDNPTFVLIQDGNRVNARFGLMGLTSQYTGALANALFISAKGISDDVDIQFVTGGSVMGGTDGTARMTIDQDGNIGIGIINPTTLLYVNGTMTIGSSSFPRNLTMFSPDGTKFSCGVLNSGVWACS